MYDDSTADKINLDDLYTNNQKKYEHKRWLYNRVLKMAHKTIQTHAQTQTHCWYEVPEIFWGEPKYSATECIAHLIYELKENGFMVRYVHPNRLFIVWKHWVPSYVRQEIKLRHGIKVNEYGQILPDEDEDADGGDNPTADSIEKNPNNGLFMQSGAATGMSSRKQGLANAANPAYKSVQSYKPRGVYNDELLNRLGEKTQKFDYK
jgi:hypothetical protein